MSSAGHRAKETTMEKIGSNVDDCRRPIRQRNYLLRVVFQLLLLTSSSGATVRYVNGDSATPAAPYTSWTTAAANIQDAVDVSTAGDQILVTNGTYVTGARAVETSLFLNRVAVTNALTLQSVNGPEFTVIQGYQVPGTTNGDEATRCVYL